MQQNLVVQFLLVASLVSFVCQLGQGFNLAGIMKNLTLFITEIVR